MRETLRQPKQLSLEDEGSLAAIGHVVEINSDLAARAEDYMNHVATEIKEVEGQLASLEGIDSEGAKKEAPILKQRLILLRGHLAQAQHSFRDAEQTAARYLGMREEIIKKLKMSS